MLKEEISHLKEKFNNQSCLISDLNTELKELSNERNSLLTVVRILQAGNQKLIDCKQQQQMPNLDAYMNNSPYTYDYMPEQKTNISA